MTVTSIHSDVDALTMQITAEFEAPIERIWRLWEDPRQLERWWGPPSYPATVVDHDLTPGGSVAYYMTGPEGDKHHGWWRIAEVDAPRRLRFADGFADADGIPHADMPTTIATVSLREAERSNDDGDRVAVPVPRGDGSDRRTWAWRRACRRRWGRSTACSRTGRAGRQAPKHGCERMKRRSPPR